MRRAQERRGGLQFVDLLVNRVELGGRLAAVVPEPIQLKDQADQ